MKKCCIFAGAEIIDYSNIRIDNSSFIICADGGYFHVKQLKLSPDVIIGDFDTLNGNIEDDCEIIKYPSEKDDTDTMLAVKLALERNYTDIEIYGAVGGRLDHTIANIQTLIYVKEHNANAKIYGDNEIIFVMRNEKNILKKVNGYYFSIFSYSEKCIGVTTFGTKYDLNNAVLTNAFPWGVSNEILADFAQVEVKTGTLLIIFSKH